MVFAKLHVGLSVATMLVAIGIFIWVIFINTNAIPYINHTKSLLSLMAASNSIYSQKIKDKSKEDISILEKYENIITSIFSLAVVGCIIFFVHGTVLLMTVSGEDCYNCCRPVQLVWKQVRREVNLCLMETTRSHSRVDEEALEEQEGVEETLTSID